MSRHNCIAAQLYVDKLTVLKKGISATDVQVRDAIIFLSSEDAAIKVCEFEKNSLKVNITDLKAKDMHQKMCEKLGTEATGTKKQLTARAERKLKATRDQYKENNLNVDEVNVLNCEVQPT